MWAKRLFLGILLLASSSSAQVIGFDDCTYEATFGVPLDMLLLYNGPPMIAAAVRITGIPTAWIRVVTPPAQTDSCGPGGCDLFVNGAYLTFPSCQTPTVQLFALTVIPTTPEIDLVFSPQKPLDSPIDCPFVTLCDEPVFTMQCVGCDQAFVNHNSPSCAVPVEEITWTSVRNLYR